MVYYTEAAFDNLTGQNLVWEQKEWETFWPQMKKIQKKAAKNKLDEGGAAEIERAMEEEKLNILASAHHHSNSSINIENASHQISIHFQTIRPITADLSRSVFSANGKRQGCFNLVY